MTNEFEQMKPLLNDAVLGSYLVIPLKYTSDSINTDWFETVCASAPVTTMDLTEQVKTMFHPDNSCGIGTFYRIAPHRLICKITGRHSDDLFDSPAFAVTEKHVPSCEIDWTKNNFDIYSLHLAVFHTGTAFLTLGIRYTQMTSLRQLCNPGRADSNAAYYYRNTDGSVHSFSLDESLLSLIRDAGMIPFFQSGSSLFLEAFTYNVAVSPERFNDLETIRRITFNQHRMAALNVHVEDNSEADVGYVYAVKDQKVNTYRWGCCVSSQTLSYIVADPEMDIDKEMQIQADDGLPLVLLALYQKYTCLHFTELLSSIDKQKMRGLRALKKMMLEFKAFGTVHPANLSRWHNVKMIYNCLLEYNGITDAIEDIDTKISILSEHQHELETKRNDTIMGLITIFGVVSILASVLSIFQILDSGDILEWIITILTTAAMILVAWAAYLWERKN